ncbi:hypothetical protein CL622_00190 [archaeon]|nr:hypothetical protein [archaeon]|tara:strand:+ start:233 stop:664 length:432 start_codon:yes stop_codon:yes gene_type:complete
MVSEISQYIASIVLEHGILVEGRRDFNYYRFEKDLSDGRNLFLSFEDYGFTGIESPSEKSCLVVGVGTRNPQDGIVSYALVEYGLSGSFSRLEWSEKAYDRSKWEEPQIAFQRRSMANRDISQVQPSFDFLMEKTKQIIEGIF